MKTFRIFLLAVMIVIGSQAFSQVLVQRKPFEPHLRINGFALYAFDDKVDSYYSSVSYYRGKMKGGFQWGGSLEYMMIPDQGVELSYLRLDSNAPLEYYDRNDNRVKFTDFDVATNYVLIGSNRYFAVNPKIEPFAGVNLGMAIFNVTNPENNRSDNSVKFAWGAKVGLNIWATEKVGIKMQTGLVSAVQGAGGGLYFGTGGIGAGVNTYSTFYQFFIGGGLAINLSKN
jgi:hypothetical protein